MPISQGHVLAAWRIAFGLLRIGDREEVLKRLTDLMRQYLERTFFRVSSFIREFDLHGAMAQIA